MTAKRSTRAPSPALPAKTAGRVRIAAAARHQFTALGFSRITMSDLARDLGMSKKTLYAHFPSKEALIEQLLDTKVSEVRKGMLSIVGDETVPFADRVHRMMTFIVREMSEVSPAFLRDLERHHPELYSRIDAVRAKILPEIWDRVLASGTADGLVRRELDPAFISEMILTAVQGLLRPAVLDRLQLPPHEVIDRVLTILFAGILTPAGRKAYENGPSR